MNATPSLRWYRFSLRTAFAIFTVACLLAAWIAYQLDWIRQRREFMSKLPTNNFAYQEDLSHPVRAPGMLWLFGESGKRRFRSVNTPGSDPETNQIKALFPEAEILQFTNGPIRILGAPASIAIV